MEDNHFNNREWFAYIQKLNDREISKSSSSGINLWALIGVVVVILFKIINSIPHLITLVDFLNKTLFCFTLLLNLVVFLTCLIYFYYSRFLSPSNETEAQMKLRNILALPRNFAFSLIILLGTIGNLFSAFFLQKHHFISWPLYFLAILFSINLIVDIITILSSKLMKKMEKTVVESLSSSSRPFSKSGVWFSFLVLFLLGYTVVNINVKSLIDSKIIVEFSFYLLGLIMCIFALSMIYTSYLKSQWLAEFEKRILIESLSAEQIKKLFTETYPD